MNVIGGYFELETTHGEHYHQGATRLNTARNCLEYILRTRGYRKIYVPYYTCEVVLEPVYKLGLEYVFYPIDENLEPILPLNMQKDEALLYTNYYGLKQLVVEKLARQYRNLIIDNSQAFYATPLAGTDTFYSARKFFGVPDGAYLYTSKPLEEVFEHDYSVGRMSHLLKRCEGDAEYGYADFKKNDDSLVDNPIRWMSGLTEKLLGGIDYEFVRKVRIENYRFIHRHLSGQNLLRLSDPGQQSVPMVYPFLGSDVGLRKKLIDQKIFVATYWPNVFDWCDKQQWEYQLTENLIPLPIDQRYGEKEMKKILNVVLQ